jgi:hypothetical protein
LPAEDEAKIGFLRHTVATLAYRGGKAIRDSPPGFAEMRIGARSRTPREILAHIGDLLEWADSIAAGHEIWPTASAEGWDVQVDRFFSGLARLDRTLSRSMPACPPEKLFQGPLADAFTHVGQIAMLRRLAASPVRGENYFRATMVAGQVGPSQAPPAREFD